MSLFDFRNLFNQCLSHVELLYDIKSYENTAYSYVRDRAWFVRLYGEITPEL